MRKRNELAGTGGVVNKIYFSNIKRPNIKDVKLDVFMECQSPANAQLLAKYFNSLNYILN